MRRTVSCLHVVRNDSGIEAIVELETQKPGAIQGEDFGPMALLEGRQEHVTFRP